MRSFNDKALFIIKAGATFPAIAETHGDFDFWIKSKIVGCKFPIHVIEAYKNETLPLAEQCVGVVITGSHAMVTDNDDWSERTIDWVSHIVKEQVPFLGICYGHHLLAKSFGGVVGDLPTGIEIGSIHINQSQAARDDLLFSGLPRSFAVHATHYQTILEPPVNSVALATSSHDNYQAIRIGACAWGVQFHPEFSSEIMMAYVENQNSQLLELGIDVAYIKQNVKSCKSSARILEIFLQTLGL